MARAEPRAALEGHAALFAALGDETRLALVGILADGVPQSISRLAERSPLTRQAITKHLGVLEGAGLVRSVRLGRERSFELRPEKLQNLRAYLARVSDHWDRALARLKALVED
jgi:DNA-binding transcriptional ArsR family regulator